jgi:hypothetical protein
VKQEVRKAHVSSCQCAVQDSSACILKHQDEPVNLGLRLTDSCRLASRASRSQRTGQPRDAEPLKFRRPIGPLGFRRLCLPEEKIQTFDESLARSGTFFFSSTARICICISDTQTTKSFNRISSPSHSQASKQPALRQPSTNQVQFDCTKLTSTSPHSPLVPSPTERPSPTPNPLSQQAKVASTCNPHGVVNENHQQFQ